MTLDVRSIVSASTQPPSHAGTRTSLRNLNVPSQRRTVLKAVATASVALGGSFLGMVTRAEPAAAETNPGGNLQGWDDCHQGYQPVRDTSGLYYNWQNACHGGTYRSSEYCNVNGWHRQDSSGTPTVTYDYIASSDRCWAASDNHNSWTWSASANRNGSGTQHPFRCSDGKVIVITAGGSTPYDTVCRFKKD